VQARQDPNAEANKDLPVGGSSAQAQSYCSRLLPQIPSEPREVPSQNIGEFPDEEPSPPF